MASRKSPLRDRLLSNSPDPLKSSILRESGMGWNPASASAAAPANTDAATSPLRIAKRDPSVKPRGPVVARRSSSSYRHVHTNNLVSKSPFKSQIPTPSTPSSRPVPIPLPTRRVSGEKRPRPSSMHEQAEAENDRPFALKRERKQSKTFQELIQKEPVTKSPFKSLQPTPLEPEPPLPPPSNSFNEDAPLQRSTSPGNFHIHVPATTSVKVSPARSALVSRRMHGPRLSGGPRRKQRKTVKFYERCDVLEFDREEESEDEEEVDFESCEDEDRNDCDGIQVERRDSVVADDPFVNQGPEPDEHMEEDASYGSIQLGDTALDSTLPSLLSDPDTSITGIVDEMFGNAHPTTLSEDGITTPTRQLDIPTDLETEDGVPFGRSHHVERFLQHHQHPSTRVHPFSPHGSPQTRHSPSGHPFNLLPTRASPLGPPSTPPRHSPIVTHNTPPLGRSTHLDRIRMAREHEREAEEEEDVNKLPASPSPMKKLPAIPGTREDGLIPSFNLKGANLPESNSDLSAMLQADPFAPRLQDEPALPELEKQNTTSDSMDPANLSLSNSEVNLSGLVDVISQETRGSRPKRPLPSVEASRPESPSHLAVHATSSRLSSPGSHSASPLLAIKKEGQGLANSPSRDRISREEVQRRLMNQRLSNSSPAPDLASSTGSLRSAAPIEELQSPTPRLSTETNIDKEKDRMSVLTTQTDFSTDTAIVETAEKKILGLATLAPQIAVDKEFGLLGASPKLDMDFGSKFSLGGFGATTFDTETRSAMTNKAAPPPEFYDSNTSGIRMGDVDVDMEMKSALDRLMEDVAGAGARADDSMTTEEYDESFDRSQSTTREASPFPVSAHPKVLERAATDSVLLQYNEASGIESRSVSGASTITEPPPVPPKDNIAIREQLILQKRRQTRGNVDDDDEEEEEDVVRRRNRDRQSLGYGRPSRRRSMSTGDAETLGGGAKKRGDALLDVVSEDNHNDDPLADSIEKELQKLARAPTAAKKSRYNVRQRGGTIYASSSDEKVSHMAGAGDLDAGRAWRMVRRPSDMNEYSKQIKEYRSQDKGKAYGKVFVRVLGIKGLGLPLPLEPTVITCTLNNGIHFVTTPECDLSRDCPINQEFELIEHSKLEFTLTFKVRRDAHIIAQYKALSPSAPAPPPPPPPPLPPAMAPSKSYGMRSFFSSSPKKTSKDKIVVQPPPPPLPQPRQMRLPENLARYLKPDGTLARAFISFKDVSSRCDTRLFETSYPLIGQRVEIGGKYSTLEVGEVAMQVFRLPPLPGLPQDQLPQSLDECHRGLRHINWHKVTYFQGTLTQSGGDCNTWRRRQLRVIGSNLVAFNDVTKRATATIDLKKAIAVEDNEKSQLSPDEYDGAYGVERSFRLVFPQHQEIIFFADTDEEKVKWLEVLRALVGHIPPHPLWAELLWQRQEEIAKRMQSAQQIIPQQQPSRQR